jgi:uncharacterized membrane protein (DUF4010 family)
MFATTQPVTVDVLLSLSVALGVGLLIGAERERRKGTGPQRAPAGIRTFAVVSLIGAVAMLLGDVTLMTAAALLVGGLTMIAYRRGHNGDQDADPGITTEVALLLTCLIGGLATRDAMLAAGMGAALAGLLAARERIHLFVKGVMSERELHDALLFAAAALIVLPLAPDRYLGPFAALNPQTLVTIVVLLMSVSALGYVLKRVLGVRFGLPIAGLVGGFVSSSATIYAMGRRTRTEPALMPGLVAGALLSSLATSIQLAIVVGFIAPDLLIQLALPLLASGVVAAAYAAKFAVAAFKTKVSADAEKGLEGRAFDLLACLSFAGVIAAVSLLSAAINATVGGKGVMAAAFVAGLADAHASAVAAASLVVAGKLAPQTAVYSVLVGYSANALVKGVLAATSGGLPYALRIVPGLALMVASVWVAALIAW